MDSSPRSPLSGSGIPNADVVPILLGPIPPAVPRNATEYPIQTEVLRRDLDTGATSVEFILRGVADAARDLTGADGTALALRTNGVIVCRARSGTMAPELDAPLNVSSGISGECLRAASILVCSDAATDSRVDAEVCTALGIQSIVVVPLRGAGGMIGILEAFSARTGAFGPEQIDSLRALAEVAEAAYDHEGRSPNRTAPPVTARPASFAPPLVVEQVLDVESSSDSHSMRRYWIFGAAIALVLVSLVVWLSWREPASEVAASETPARPVSAPEGSSSSPSLQVVPLKPAPGIVARQPDRLRSKDMLQNAAEIQPASEGSIRNGRIAETSLASGPKDKTATPKQLSVGSEPLATLPPPTVEVAASTIPAEVAGVSTTPAALPTLGAAVSQGVTEGTLIHKVDPTYPPEGLVQRLAGSVTLEVTISEDGSVSDVKTLSGPPVLAAAAAAAISHWRYSPWKLSGKPVEVQKQIAIVFKLP